uniref:Cyclin-H n=1 Tax=Phallusia mammillata TaxID=59560 RepID=A0A6F9D9H7_9ASCI|nr:cyclin-H-like [Phallusia mammillata]
MFHNSTQRKFWTFETEEEIDKLRENSNAAYRQKFCARNKNVSVDDDNFFITTNEHRVFVRHYEEELKEFCWKFKPPMPLSAIGTAWAYMRRLYLRRSVMHYHPKLMYLVCIWLACKTEEFNISMEQYAQSISDDNEVIKDAILTIELVLIQELNFHLTVHNPFRPLEGFFIDLKTRFPPFSNPDQLREHAKDFLIRSLSTDVTLLFTPSQLSLAALLSAASKCSKNIDRYVTDTLLKGQPQKVLRETIQRIKKIRTILKSANTEKPSQEEIRRIELKLERCYDKSKDPTSQEYTKIQNMLEAEKHERHAKKRKLEIEKRQKIESDLLRF